ncbi:hypothetical protein BK004_03900 [bacterium CG10_46_32]|nr:MAG: hypothetical protein BK004_03900 [bacterium CG10_46_32]PIR55872.1 MAG: hypothetical protein COU73_03930 [Parcubacteria group bacterium CG10_big_fil_rev_8_21_14_0_10_46_32]
MEIVTQKISLERLKELAQEVFGDMVKVVVDVERAIMAAGGEMHADCEQILLENGSTQEDLWGANIYPDSTGEDFIEYQSLINIRPRVGNRGMEIEDEAIRSKVKAVIEQLVQ